MKTPASRKVSAAWRMASRLSSAKVRWWKRPVGAGEPHARLLAAVELDALGAAQPERALEEFAAGADIHGEAVEVVDPPHVHAARRIALGLVLQRGAAIGGRVVPLRLPVELEDMAVRVAEAPGRAVAEVAVDADDVAALGPQRGEAALERGGAARAEGGVPEARGGRGGELQRVPLVVVPAAQKDAVTLRAAHRHAHHVAEEGEALLRLRRQQLDMAEMGQVHDRFGRVHRFLLPAAAGRAEARRGCAALSYRFFGAGYPVPAYRTWRVAGFPPRRCAAPR